MIIALKCIIHSVVGHFSGYYRYCPIKKKKAETALVKIDDLQLFYEYVVLINDILVRKLHVVESKNI